MLNCPIVESSDIHYTHEQHNLMHVYAVVSLTHALGLAALGCKIQSFYLMFHSSDQFNTFY